VKGILVNTRNQSLMNFMLIIALSMIAIPSIAWSMDVTDQKPTAFEIISSDPKLLTFKKALDRSGLSAVLKKGGDITVFAPTNAAFDEWPTDELAKLFAQPVALRTLVEFHLVDGLIDIDSLQTRQYLVTRLGRLVSVMRDEPYILIDDARILDGDKRAVNGIVHIIDTVLEP